MSIFKCGLRFRAVVFGFLPKFTCGTRFPISTRFTVFAFLISGSRFLKAVFGFCLNLYAACGFSNPLGLRSFAFFTDGSRFLDAIFGFCSTLNAASGILECGVRFLEQRRYKTITFYSWDGFRLLANFICSFRFLTIFKFSLRFSEPL